MKFSKITLMLILLLSFFSCSRQYKIARVIPGSTYIDQAVLLLDEPVISKNSSLTFDHKIYIWKDLTLQVNPDNLVTAVHRQPASHEKTLQFWKQYYKDTETDFYKISTDKSSQESLWQFTIPNKGMSVIYDENIDQVTKVILYEVP